MWQYSNSIKHSWGTTPKQKAREKEYNHLYYLRNKEKWLDNIKPNVEKETSYVEEPNLHVKKESTETTIGKGKNRVSFWKANQHVKTNRSRLNPLGKENYDTKSKYYSVHTEKRDAGLNYYSEKNKKTGKYDAQGVSFYAGTEAKRKPGGAQEKVIKKGPLTIWTSTGGGWNAIEGEYDHEYTKKKVSELKKKTETQKKRGEQAVKKAVNKIGSRSSKRKAPTVSKAKPSRTVRQNGRGGSYGEVKIAKNNSSGEYDIVMRKKNGRTYTQTYKKPEAYVNSKVPKSTSSRKNRPRSRKKYIKQLY